MLKYTYFFLSDLIPWFVIVFLFVATLKFLRSYAASLKKLQEDFHKDFILHIKASRELLQEQITSLTSEVLRLRGAADSISDSVSEWHNAYANIEANNGNIDPREYSTKTLLCFIQSAILQGEKPIAEKLIAAGLSHVYSKIKSEKVTKGYADDSLFEEADLLQEIAKENDLHLHPSFSDFETWSKTEQHFYDKYQK